LTEKPAQREPGIRIEVLVLPAVAERIVDFLRREIHPEFAITVSVETVEVLREDAFVAQPATEGRSLESVH
jgi:hypothetical protein